MEPGRPPTAVTDENVVDEDNRITCEDIQAVLGVGSAATNDILRGRLGLKRVIGRCTLRNPSFSPQVNRRPA